MGGWGLQFPCSLAWAHRDPAGITHCLLQGCAKALWKPGFERKSAMSRKEEVGKALETGSLKCPQAFHSSLLPLWSCLRAVKLLGGNNTA